MPIFVLTSEKHLFSVKNAYKLIQMVENTYFEFILSNLGYTFYDSITLLKTRKDVLYNLFSDSKGDMNQLTKGTHPRYKKKKSEDWDILTFNNTEVPVCTRKFASNHGIVRLVDRSVDELKHEAERIYGILKENNKL